MIVNGPPPKFYDDPDILHSVAVPLTRTDFDSSLHVEIPASEGD